jgi:hypothetical protein
MAIRSQRNELLPHPPIPNENGVISSEDQDRFNRAILEILDGKQNTLRDDLDELEMGDIFLKIPMGDIGKLASVNKFGRATDVDATATDIWDRANATDTQAIWVAPTAARAHNIISSTGADTSAGAGAKTIEVFGLTSWTATEVSETITMTGTSNALTSNSYVIIHRMKVLTKGASGPNAGIIKATAVSDGTVTAQINAGEGQTQMAIYGIPSVVNAYMTAYYSSTNKSGPAGGMDISVLVNPEPDAELTSFLVKHTQGLATTGTSHEGHVFAPYFKVSGPAIIKVQGNGSTTNFDVSAGFDLILERT